ncbi:MAG: DUF4372 domain-containing protein [Flavobacteriales bacterium]|nr:DUF4372 domain-containing protein [Flavobacteriales bacterium]
MDKEHQADRYCKTLFTYDHLVTMLSAIYMGCTGLRELVTGLQACQQRLRHLGLKQNPRRSTLADANKRRTEALFVIFHGLYRRYYGDSRDSRRRKDGPLGRLHVLDSTTITLFSDVLQGTGAFGLNGRKKGWRQGPCGHACGPAGPLLHRPHRRQAQRQAHHGTSTLTRGSVVVFDMGYTNYAQWAAWDKQGVFGLRAYRRVPW